MPTGTLGSRNSLPGVPRLEPMPWKVTRAPGPRVTLPVLVNWTVPVPGWVDWMTEVVLGERVSGPTARVLLPVALPT